MCADNNPEEKEDRTAVSVSDAKLRPGQYNCTFFTKDPAEKFDEVWWHCHPVIEVAYNGGSLGALSVAIFSRGFRNIDSPWLNSDNFSFEEDLPVILSTVFLFALFHWIAKSKIDKRTIRQVFAGLRNVLRIGMVVVHNIAELNVTWISSTVLLSIGLVYGACRGYDERKRQQRLDECDKPNLSKSKIWTQYQNYWLIASTVGIFDGVYLVSAIINILMMMFSSFDLTSNVTKAMVIAAIIIVALFSFITKWYEECQGRGLVAKGEYLPDFMPACRVVAKAYTYFREFFNGIKNFTTPLSILFLIITATTGTAIPLSVIIVVVMLGMIYGVYLCRKKIKENKLLSQLEDNKPFIKQPNSETSASPVVTPVNSIAQENNDRPNKQQTCAPR